MRLNRMKRGLAVLLALVMGLGLVPASAFAGDVADNPVIVDGPENRGEDPGPQEEAQDEAPLIQPADDELETGGGRGELALRVRVGAKYRDVAGTELSAYAVGEDRREGVDIYHTVIPEDSGTMWIYLTGFYAVRDVAVDEPVLFGGTSASVPAAGPGQEDARAWFDADELAAAGVDDEAPLRLLEIFETQADYESGTVRYALLAELSYVRPRITVAAPEEEAARAVFSTDLPYSFYCEGNTSGGEDKSSGTITLTGWDTDKYAFAGWRIEGNEPVGNGTATVNYGSSSSYSDDFAEYFDCSATGSSYRIYFSYSSGTYQFSWSINNGAGLIRDMEIEPVFTEKRSAEFTPTLVQTEGGTVARVRVGEDETHALTATPETGWYFDRWEYSHDSDQWAELETLPAASGNVELEADTWFRAVFRQYVFDISGVTYALTGEGDWLLNFTLNYETRLTTAAPLEILVYEGTDEGGTQLAAINSLSAGTNRDTQTFQIAVSQRPEDTNGTVYLTTRAGTGYTGTYTLPLAGTLEIDPAGYSLNTTEAIFLERGPLTRQLSVDSDSPLGEVSWTSGNASFPVDETGLVTHAHLATSVTFTADAGDGRVAYGTGTYTTRSAVKFAQSSLVVNEGEAARLYATHNLTRLQADSFTLESGDDGAVIAYSVVEKFSGTYTVVDYIEVYGLQAGNADLTIKYNGDDDLAYTCQVLVAGGVEAQSLTLEPAELTLVLGDSRTLAYAAEPVEAAVTYAWSVDNGSVVSVDRSGTVTAVGAGTATVTLRTTDTYGNVLEATCAVTVTDDPYRVTVYAPVGTDISLYPTSGYLSDGSDLFDPESEITAEVTAGDGYSVYTVELPAGTYSFRGVDGDTDVGGGTFAVPAPLASGGYSTRESTEIYLRRARFGVTNAGATAEDFTVASVATSGVAVFGEAVSPQGDNPYYHALLYVNGNANLYYTTINPTGAYAGENGVASAYSNSQAYAASPDTLDVMLTLGDAVSVTINVPDGAEVGMYYQIRNFNTVEYETKTVEVRGDGTTDHIYRLSGSNSTISYRVSMEGMVTQAGFLSSIADGQVITVEMDETLDPKAQYTDNTAYNLEASTLLNINERSKLSLQVGETYKVRGYRAAWQIINNITANIMIEPDFHYEILSGGDVISIEQVDGGNAGGNWAWVTAKKEGVAIVEVSYDALSLASSTSATAPTLNGASESKRTGVFVVQVGGDGANIGGIDWDAEYNTHYFLEETGSLTLDPMGEDVAVRVATVYDGALGSWQTVGRGANGFDVPIADGNNVVEITADGYVDYRVIRGSRLTPVITSPNEDGNVYPGDTVTLSFSGLYHPAPKFSGIYNPSSSMLVYRQGDTFVYGSGGQYGVISTAIHFTIPEDAEGTVTLESGLMTVSVMGSSYPAHRQLTDVGVPANFSAGNSAFEDNTLPDVTVTVTRPPIEAAIASAIETIEAAFARYGQSDYTAENWALLVRAREDGLTAVKNAASLSEVTAARNAALLAMSAIERISGGADPDPGTGTGRDKTHTGSYYPTTGLEFDLAAGDADGYVTISFSDYGIRLADADYKVPLGVIIAPTQVPYRDGENMADVTLRLLDALDIGYTNAGNGSDGFYLSAIQNFCLSDGYLVDEFGEFDAGSGSGWMVALNNWFINRSASDFPVEDGDSIKWQYTCQMGADIGCDWNIKSAEIIGLSFKENYGRLSPAFDREETAYVYTVSPSVKAVALEAVMENYWSTVTITADGVTYKPMQDIPVKNGTVIQIHSSYTENVGDPPSDTDALAVTIQVEGETPVEPTDPDNSGNAEEPWENPYSDLDGDEWYFDAVQYVTENELMDGVGGGRFAPGDDMTRAMFVTLLYRLDGEPGIEAENPFTDVEGDEWYTDAILWAVENELVVGYGDGRFGAWDQVTREQMAVLLFRYSAYRGWDVTARADLSGYPDAGGISADWALEAMAWAGAERLVTGHEDGTLAPADASTRAQVATLIMRFLEEYAAGQ